MKHLIKVKEISNITDVDYDRIILAEDGSIHAQGGGVNTSNIYNAIDLGLPSGLLWCDRNVGATNITDTGLYFQWGDTSTFHKKEELEVTIGSADIFGVYKWWNGLFTKYNDEDGLTTLELKDDAAHVFMGGDWRMPTHEELKELFTNTDITLIYKNGTEAKGIVDENGFVSWENVDLSGEEQDNNDGYYLIQGIQLTGRGEYSNNSIFIPAAGYLDSDGYHYPDKATLLWSASLFVEYHVNAINARFDSDGCDGCSNNIRCYVTSVRGVITK